jgi:hypothetical protein
VQLAGGGCEEPCHVGRRFVGGGARLSGTRAVAQPDDGERSAHGRRQTRSFGAGSTRGRWTSRFLRPLVRPPGCFRGACRRVERAIAGAGSRARRKLLQGSPHIPVPAQRPRDSGRVASVHPIAFSHRDRLRQPRLPAHLHGRSQAGGQPRTNVDGLFRRTVGGDTLVVDSFGFNDRTWLDARGCRTPKHSERRSGTGGTPSGECRSSSW